VCRYRLAVLSLSQKQVNSLRSVNADGQVPNKSVVFDAVTIGFKFSKCHMVRPWEEPNDLEALKGAPGGSKIRPSDLYQGCELERYTMVPAHLPRRVLWNLSQGECVTAADGGMLLNWLKVHRPEILPFLRTSTVSYRCG
jgi:hypothetical protein